MGKGKYLKGFSLFGLCLALMLSVLPLTGYAEHQYSYTCKVTADLNKLGVGKRVYGKGSTGYCSNIYVENTGGIASYTGFSTSAFVTSEDVFYETTGYMNGFVKVTFNITPYNPVETNDKDVDVKPADIEKIPDMSSEDVSDIIKESEEDKSDAPTSDGGSNSGGGSDSGKGGSNSGNDGSSTGGGSTGGGNLADKLVEESKKSDKESVTYTNNKLKELAEEGKVSGKIVGGRYVAIVQTPSGEVQQEITRELAVDLGISVGGALLVAETDENGNLTGNFYEQSLDGENVTSDLIKSGDEESTTDEAVAEDEDDKKEEEKGSSKWFWIIIGVFAVAIIIGALCVKQIREPLKDFFK